MKEMGGAMDCNLNIWSQRGFFFQGLSRNVSFLEIHSRNYFYLNQTKMFYFCLDEDLRFARYLMFDKINFENLVIPMILCDYVLGVSFILIL